MRAVLYVLSFLGLIALGFWAYRENYATQGALKEVEALQRQIADLREGLSVQRAEWAYLNRPDRLRDLATANFDRLGLLPMEPSSARRQRWPTRRRTCRRSTSRLTSRAPIPPRRVSRCARRCDRLPASCRPDRRG